MKNKGFTLIELLVIIGIVGILSAISVGMFSGFTEKARDSLREDTLMEVSSFFKHGALEKDGSDVYIYNDVDIEILLANFSYSIKSGIGGLCYFIGMTRGATPSPDDNEFAIVTWGEATSTKEDGVPGLLVSGTAQAVANIKNAAINGSPTASLYEQDFSCNNLANFEKVYQAFIGDPSFTE